MDALPSRMIGDALRVVTGGGGDYSLLAFGGCKRKQLVQRTALFESSSALLIIEFEKNRVAGKGGKRSPSGGSRWCESRCECGSSPFECLVGQSIASSWDRTVVAASP